MGTTRHTWAPHLDTCQLPCLACPEPSSSLPRSRSSTRYSSLPSHSLFPICGAQANPLCQRASYRLDQTSIHPAISSLISSVSLLPVSPALIRPCMRLLMDMARETATVLRPSTPMAPLHPHQQQQQQHQQQQLGQPQQHMMYNPQQYGAGPGQGHPQSQFPGAPGPSMGGNPGAMGMMQNNGMAQMAGGHVPRSFRSDDCRYRVGYLGRSWGVKCILNFMSRK